MKKTKIKAISLMICLLMVAGIVVGGTIAFLKAESDEITNTFEPSHVTTEVAEDPFTGDVKSNVRIVNTGDTEAFIRAAIVVTWQDGNGNIYGKAPVAQTDTAEGDYTISYGENWIHGDDGFWYYKDAVAGNNGETGNLIEECAPVNGKAPAGYNLCVEILGSGIQSKPTDVVVNSWKVTLDDNGVITAGGVK